jgi:hypothetical protein
LLASGDLYIDFYDSAMALTGFLDPDEVGNCKKFALKVETEKKENKLNGRDTLGQTGDVYTRLTGSTISLALNRYTSRLLAAAMMGSTTDLTAEAGAFDEASITAVHDRCVVKDEADATTYDVTDDYEVNLRLGMIKVLSTGDIADGATLHITGTLDAKTGSKILGSNKTTVNVKLKLDGKDNVSGDDVQITVYQAQLSSDTEFDLMAEDFPELTFTGTMVTPAGLTSPFEMI